MGDELKACPFCGSAPKVDEPTSIFSASVACESDNCVSQPAANARTVERAIAAWNTRTDPRPAPVADVQTTARQRSPIVADNGDHFLVAHVSKDGSMVGIDHPCDAVWADVMTAHVALRDRINERIAAQDGCPFKPPVADELKVKQVSFDMIERGWSAFVLALSDAGIDADALLDPLTVDQERGIVADILTAALATRSDPSGEFRCHNCKRVVRALIAPERCAECKCSSFSAIVPLRTRSDPSDELVEVLKAADHYAATYLLDELCEPELCLDQAHHDAVCKLFSALSNAGANASKAVPGCGEGK